MDRVVPLLSSLNSCVCLKGHECTVHFNVHLLFIILLIILIILKKIMKDMSMGNPQRQFNFLPLFFVTSFKRKIFILE